MFQEARTSRSSDEGSDDHAGNGSKDTAQSRIEVFDIIAKMFSDPVPSPSPISAEYLPASTEMLSHKQEEDCTKYSPVMWADPLIPFEIKVTTDDKGSEVMPAVAVNINNDRLTSWKKLELSTAVLRMKRNNDTRSTVIASIMDQTFLDGTPSLDEAAIMRLLMLQMLTMDAKQQIYASTSINQSSINTTVKHNCGSLVWTEALKESTKLQIGYEKGTSNLYFRTLYQYEQMLSCGEPCIRDMSGCPVNFNDVVFIPVKQDWQNRAWLIPYIISFTTTAWWNHACTINVDYTNTGPIRTEGREYSARFMPKAATVYIPGTYQYICLVVVDPNTINSFHVCYGITANFDGEFEFAKLVYSYLGRYTDKNIRGMDSNDIKNAVNNVIGTLCTLSEFRQIQLKASVLCTSRFNGYGCYPNPEAPPVCQVGDEKQRKHLFGPAQFNGARELNIGDYILPDLLGMTPQECEDRLRVMQTWRCDPLGYFAFSEVNVKLNNALSPCLSEFISGCSQYELLESSANVRILKAMGMFDGTEPTKYICTNPAQIFNTVIAYGSLLLGLSNWAFTKMGCTMFEHNRMGDSWHSLPKNYFELWPSLTQNFVVPMSKYQDRIIDHFKYTKLWGWIMNPPFKTYWYKDWINTHYSWNVPWWYVAAVAAKFGHELKMSTTTNAKIKDFKDNTIQGWLMKNVESTQFNLSILTSSCEYEKQVRSGKLAYFHILTPTSSGQGEAYNFLSWDLNGINDYKKLQYKSEIYTTNLNISGNVELNVVVFPSARAAKMTTCHLQSFVSSYNRVDPNDESTLPLINGGLRWPNVDKGWLKKSGI